MKKPKNITRLRLFLGAVTYYRNMWPRCSHLLRPLTALTGKRTWEWTTECDEAFEQMKALMASNIMMRNPDPNKPFELYTDASDHQMGAVIMQEGKPVAYWSCKLNQAQMNYNVMEKEMLSIVHCLKEFRSMLLGTQLTIYTDHRNLTFRTLNTARVLRWRMYMEEYFPVFKYLPGKQNIIADCFSRLPRMEKPSEGKSLAKNKGKLINFQNLNVQTDPGDETFLSDDLLPPPSEAEFNREMKCMFSCCRDGDSHTHFIGDPDMVESFLNHLPLQTMNNPITMHNIQQHQLQDQDLLQKAVNPVHYTNHPIKQIDNRYIICFIPDLNHPNHWKICLPNTLLQPVIVWYHVVLGHRGASSVHATITQRFYAPELTTQIRNLGCKNCQINKAAHQQYGHLPERHVDLELWFSVAVDLIGP